MTVAGFPWRLGLALAVLALGLVLLAFAQPPSGAHARLFAGEAPAIDLRLNDEDHVVGTLGGLVAPGDVRSGLVQLSHRDATPNALLDLDVDFRVELRDEPPPADPPLTRLLQAKELRYGPDDLLRDDPGVAGDRNLTREIDGHPLFGNGDGKLDLAELEAGANDLPGPGPPAHPTVFRIALLFAPEAPNGAMGDVVDLELVFLLSDTAQGDLN